MNLMAEKMLKVYQALTWPVNLENLRFMVNDARETGVMFNNGLFSVLDDLDSRGQKTLVIPNDIYRP